MSERNAGSGRFEAVELREVRRHLWGWVVGEEDEADLVDFADAHLPEEPISDIHDRRRPIYVALDVMSTIFVQPFVRKDALAVLRYISLWEEDPKQAEEWISDYWDSIDWEAHGRDVAFDGLFPRIRKRDADSLRG